MYLRIRNRGVADHRAFTMIGVSTTRYSQRDGTVGQFGSGSKNAIALLLRNGIRPIITTGNLKLEFFTKPEHINGITFNRVCVKYTGTDVDDSTKNRTEDLGFVLEWGVQDWTEPSMAVREFVANAIDGSIEAGLDHTDVDFEVVDKPRAKADHTAVFLPYTQEIEEVYRSLGTMFLHFGAPDLLKQKLLPKRNPGEEKVLIYKQGVLVSYLHGNSVFDYNLGSELSLDESRNAHEWDVKYAVSHALRDAPPDMLATVIKAVLADKETWEAKLDTSYLTTNTYGDGSIRERRIKAFQTAWKAVVGEKGVVTTGSVSLSSFVKNKGFTPVKVESPTWFTVLESYDIPSETKILSKEEQEGKITQDATPEMLASVDKVWGVLEGLNLTKGKVKPGCRAFYCIMDGGAQTRGYYLPNDDKIFVHKDLVTSFLLDKVVLEEIVHYVTESEDGSRDIQDFLFRAVIALAFPEPEMPVTDGQVVPESCMLREVTV